MRLCPKLNSKWIAPLILLFCLLSSFGSSLDQLRATPNLTPEKFATLFTQFAFIYSDDVQNPVRFLDTHAGDCDDFSILAASILKEKGYTPRLIAIRMPKIVHVVCYIEQTHAYLDYNLRQTSALVPCDSDISQIAASVARSYGLTWSSASEFTWDATASLNGNSRGAKRLVKTVVAPKAHNGIFATILK